MNWPVRCPHCGREFDSFDSYGDSRQMRDAHMLHAHADEPDPTLDARFGWPPPAPSGSDEQGNRPATPDTNGVHDTKGGEGR